MILNTSLAKSILMAASIGLVVPVVMAESAAPESEAEQEGKIEGTEVQRADGRWLGLTVEGARPKLSFYDKKKMPEAVDVHHAVVRITFAGRSTERGVMNVSGDGKSLSLNRPLRAPWVFVAHVTFIGEDGEAGESYAINFSG